MSDINCARCGEPWDSTGGLHHTKGDLQGVRPYWLLVFGWKCPACDENLGEISDDARSVSARISQWQRSVERLSEGMTDFSFLTFDRRPWFESFSPNTYDTIELATPTIIHEVYAKVGDVLKPGVNSIGDKYLVTVDDLRRPFLCPSFRIWRAPPLLLNLPAVMCSLRRIYGDKPRINQWKDWVALNKLTLQMPVNLFWQMLNEESYL